MVLKYGLWVMHQTKTGTERHGATELVRYWWTGWAMLGYSGSRMDQPIPLLDVAQCVSKTHESTSTHQGEWSNHAIGRPFDGIPIRSRVTPVATPTAQGLDLGFRNRKQKSSKIHVYNLHTVLGDSPSSFFSFLSHKPRRLSVAAIHPVQENEHYLINLNPIECSNRMNRVLHRVLHIGDVVKAAHRRR